jgi:hypothetical protein
MPMIKSRGDVLGYMAVNVSNNIAVLLIDRIYLFRMRLPLDSDYFPVEH